MNKKYAKAVIVILLCSMLWGCVNNRIMDGDGMINYDGLFMEEICGEWHDTNEEYILSIDEKQTITLSHDECEILSTPFHFFAPGNDTKLYTEIELDTKTLTNDTGEVVASVEKLYHENDGLFMEIQFDDGRKEIIEFEIINVKE